jgi:biopolymer transport protein ExbB/TolQ
MAQNPQGYVAPRSLALTIEEPEHACEITLAVWAMILLTWKFRRLGQEYKMLDLDYVTLRRGERILPENSLGFFKALRAKMDENPRWRGRILPEIILTALNRFHTTRSIQDTAGAISARAEVAANEFDADLSLIRTAMWGIPAIGFIGTVRGLGEALAHAQRASGIIGVTDALAPAFNAALVALLLSTVLMLMTHLMKSQQDKLILEAQNFCHENIVAQMKEPARESEAPAYQV